jgi:hypothetical protein
MPTWIAIFIVVAAVAIVVQAIVLTALFFRLRRTAIIAEKAIGDLRTQVLPILSRVQVLIEDVTPRLTLIMSEAADMTRMARSQVQRVDRVFGEMMERLRLQLIHVDQILTGAMETIEETGSRLRESILGPVVKASALVRGIQTGIEFFRNSRRKRPEPRIEQHQDEGMFI